MDSNPDVAQKRFRLLFGSIWLYQLETLAIADVNGTAISRYGHSR